MNYVRLPWKFLKLGPWTKDTYLYKFVMYCNWLEIATSLFISLCIWRDLPQQKIHMELCGEGDPPLYFYVPMFPWKYFWWNGSGKFKNTWRKEKEEIFFQVCEDSHTRVFSTSRECPQATALVQSSLRRTHLYGNLPYNKMSQICSTLMCFLVYPMQHRSIDMGRYFILPNAHGKGKFLTPFHWFPCWFVNINLQ